MRQNTYSYFFILEKFRHNDDPVRRSITKREFDILKSIRPLFLLKIRHQFLHHSHSAFQQRAIEGLLADVECSNLADHQPKNMWDCVQANIKFWGSVV